MNLLRSMKENDADLTRASYLLLLPYYAERSYSAAVEKILLALFSVLSECFFCLSSHFFRTPRSPTSSWSGLFHTSRHAQVQLKSIASSVRRSLISLPSLRENRPVALDSDEAIALDVKRTKAKLSFLEKLDGVPSSS